MVGFSSDSVLTNRGCPMEAAPRRDRSTNRIPTPNSHTRASRAQSFYHQQLFFKARVVLAGPVRASARVQLYQTCPYPCACACVTAYLSLRSLPEANIMARLQTPTAQSNFVPFSKFLHQTVQNGLLWRFAFFEDPILQILDHGACDGARVVNRVQKTSSFCSPVRGTFSANEQ